MGCEGTSSCGRAFVSAGDSVLERGVGRGLDSELLESRQRCLFRPSPSLSLTPPPPLTPWQTRCWLARAKWRQTRSRWRHVVSAMRTHVGSEAGEGHFRFGP